MLYSAMAKKIFNIKRSLVDRDALRRITEINFHTVYNLINITHEFKALDTREDCFATLVVNGLDNRVVSDPTNVVRWDTAHGATPT